MNDERPYFRFNPGAYSRSQSFEPSEDSCAICARPCEWKYIGSIYALSQPTVCARCIAGGRLRAFLGDQHFVLHDVDIGEAEPALAEEVLQRTPGFACFNPFDWPVVDGTPLAFLGYGEDKELVSAPAVRTAMEEAFVAFGWEFGPSPYVLIFKELCVDRYKVVIDLD